MTNATVPLVNKRTTELVGDVALTARYLARYANEAQTACDFSSGLELSHDDRLDMLDLILEQAQALVIGVVAAREAAGRSYR